MDSLRFRLLPHPPRPHRLSNNRTFMISHRKTARPVVWILLFGIILVPVPSHSATTAPFPSPSLDVVFPETFPSIDYAAVARENNDTTFDTRAQWVSRKAATEMIQEFHQKMRRAHQILKRIVDVPNARRTVRNTLEAFDDFNNQMEDASNWPGFYAYVHPDPFIRAAGEEIDKFSSQYLVEVGSSRALYLAFESLAQSAMPMTDDEKYLLDEILMDFEDGGVALPDTPREEFKTISKQLSDFSIEFSSNLRSYRDTLAVTLDQLAGMDNDYISRLQRAGDSLYILTLDYPVFLPYMDYGKNEEVRKILLTKFRNRSKDKNIPLLEKVIQLRQRLATLIGRPSYADYVIARRMVKTPHHAVQFLQDVQGRVDKKAKSEMSELTKLKREETGAASGGFEQWDRMYYSKILTQRKYGYEPQKVKEYFEAPNVIRALLDISQKMYGLEYRRVNKKYWHPDVVRYDVYSGGNRIGEFYLDLYPRPDKYTHAAAWGILPHKIFPDGHEQLPVAALVCNFPKPQPGRPSLLSFDDVETFFHEFGHLLHGILSTTRFAEVSGTRVKRDFVEAPSQMFEKWIQDTNVLSTFARHYQTGETIPAVLVDRIVKSRNVTSGIETQRQLFYALYDLTLHTSQTPPDVVKLWFDMKRDIEKMEEIPGTYGPAGFDHLMGYAAGYYGYMWSRMIAADMYEEFQTHGGLLNPAVGIRFRAVVLSQGGSKPPDDLVRAFLGRNPSIGALMRDLGIED